MNLRTILTASCGLALCILFTTGEVYSAPYEPMLFGPEFTFTNDHMTRTDEKREEKIHELAEILRQSCTDCQVFKFHSNQFDDEYGYYQYSNSVKYDNGPTVVFKTDFSVVEVNMSPMTNEEIGQFKARLQIDIFDNFKKIGLEPDIITGDGHIHFDIQRAFNNDLLVFRNFLVDMANHSDFANGVLSDDMVNSKPIGSLGSDLRNQFIEAIKMVDEGKIKSIEEMTDRLPNGKKMAVNITKRTVELRFFAPQKNAEEFHLLTRLIEGRIQYLRTLKEPIPVKTLWYLKYLPWPIKLKRFKQFVKESGMNFNEFSNFEFYDPNINYWVHKMKKKSCLVMLSN